MDFEQQEHTPPPREVWRLVLLYLFWGALIVGVIALLGPFTSYLTVVLPLLVIGGLAWFLYHVFLRKYLRLRRIRNAHERRLLREASRR